MVKKYLKILLISIVIFTQVFPFSGNYVYAALQGTGDYPNYTSLNAVLTAISNDIDLSIDKINIKRKDIIATR